MKTKLHRLAIAAMALAAMLASVTPVPSAPPTPPPESDAPPARVTRRAWAATANAQQAGLIVTVAGFPDLSPARALPTKEAKTRFVVEALLRHAQQAQAGLRRDLSARGVRYQVLWINNSLFIPAAGRDLMRWLAARPDVVNVDLDAQMRGVQAGIQRPESRGQNSESSAQHSPLSTQHSALTTHHSALTTQSSESKIQNTKSKIQSPQSIEWGVSRVRAPDVWAMGFTGQGIVVADLDTGVKWDHPALIGAYRGWNGSSADHTYNWYDAAYDQAGDTPSPFPHDDNGHGTHTTGTIIGDDGTGNQIGVAPGARWIACRNMRGGIGSVARYTLCFQFSLAPTDLNGNNPDPSKAADITSNSWGCDPGYGEIGCDVPSALVTVTQVLRDAGVMTVAAAGNQGSACSTVVHAPGTLDQAFTVGATNSVNAIASFSSRGPSSFTGHLKPDVVAPGVSVRSAYLANNYVFLSGTSMATPHVAGVVALLWSAAPWLRGQIDETEAILRLTAQPLTTSQNCGGVPPGDVPNNTYGYGLIDARAAVSAAYRLGALAVAAHTMPLHQADAPVTYTLVLTNRAPVTQTDLIVTATVPASTTLLTTEPPAIAHNGAATWTVTSLPPFAALSVTVVVSASPGLHTMNDYVLSAPALSGVYTGQPAITLVYAHRRWMAPVYR